MACLCFSTSEGLRLSPFPVFELEESGAPKAQLEDSGSNELTSRYNPTIVPARSLKRGKHVLEHEDLPSQSSRELTVQILLLPVTRKAEEFISRLLISRIPSRAPPFTS